MCSCSRRFRSKRLYSEKPFALKYSRCSGGDLRSPLAMADPKHVQDQEELAGLIRKAMAYRVKYRIPGGKKRISVELLGVHPLNRHGIYPNEHRIQTLGQDILRDGFNLSEAHHEGVCVQEVPGSEQAKIAAAAANNPYQSYHDYNVEKCKGPILSACYNGKLDTLYGTLSHSHLLLVLLSFKNQAVWEVNEDFKQLLGTTGAWNYELVAAKDPQLRDLCELGLEMEVLSWKMYTEEPEACHAISQALNKGQELALKTSLFTAVAALTGAIDFEMQKQMANSIVYEQIVAKLRNELRQYVDEPEFVDLFEFVVQLGASKAPFIPHLLAFGSKFVDSKVRQLRLQAFAEANKLPHDCPWVKIALILRSLRKTPQRTWCPPPEATWVKMPRARLERLQGIFLFFHYTCQRALQNMDAPQRLALLCNVDCVCAEAALQACFGKSANNSDYDKAILKAAYPFYKEVQNHCKSWVLSEPTPTEAWIEFTAVAAELASEATQAEETEGALKVLPKVIEYDEASGKPVTSQDTRTHGETRIEDVAILPWKEWQASAVAQALDETTGDIAAIQLALRSIHHKGNVGTLPVTVKWESQSKRRWVEVTADGNVEDIVMMPCCPQSGKIHKTSTHPERVPIIVSETSMGGGEGDKDAAVAAVRETTYYIHPEYKMPMDETPQASSSSAGGSRAWRWSGEETMYPFWAVERLTTDDMKKKMIQEPGSKFNCQLKDYNYHAVTVGAYMGSSVAYTLNVKIPGLVNSLPVKAGDCLYWESQPKASNKRKDIGWKADAFKPDKKASSSTTAKAKAKAKANSAGMVIEI